MVRADDGPFVGLPLDAGAGGMTFRALFFAAGGRMGVVHIAGAYVLRDVAGFVPTPAELGCRVTLTPACLDEEAPTVQEVLHGVMPTNNCVWLTLVTRGR